MSEKLEPIANIDRLSRLVETTLLRATPSLPHSLIIQCGGLLRHCLRQHLRGNPAHPGLAKMAWLGKCSTRQARRNIRMLEAWGVMSLAEYAQGGRWAPRYWFDLAALHRTLITLGCNPSKSLAERILTAGNDVRVATRGAICPDKWPDIMSAGIQKDNPSQKRWVH